MPHYWRPQMFPMRCLALNLTQTPIEKTRQREGMLTRLRLAHRELSTGQIAFSQPCPSNNGCFCGSILTRKWRSPDEYIFSTLILEWIDRRHTARDASSPGDASLWKIRPLPCIELAESSFLLEGLKKMICSGYDALTEQWRFKNGQAFSVWRLLRRSLLWQGKILKPNTVDHETINVGKTYPRPIGRVSSKRSYKPAFSGSTDHKHRRK